MFFRQQENNFHFLNEVFKILYIFSEEDDLLKDDLNLTMQKKKESIFRNSEESYFYFLNIDNLFEKWKYDGRFVCRTGTLVS